ncbi:MAG: hypothetical protein ACKO3F_18250 [Cyanobium sp.]
MASSPSEHEIQQRIRLACGRGAVRLWRNKAGALLDREDQMPHLRAAAAAGAGARLQSRLGQTRVGGPAAQRLVDVQASSGRRR